MEASSMKKVVIVSGVRTPIGDFGGSLQTVKPLDLMMTVMKESLRRAQLDKEDLDQVIVGNCFSPIDQNVARIASLLMGVPDRVPGYTINCACASASQAIIAGANAIALGQADIVLAGGVESMSNAPYIMETARWGQRLRHAQVIDLFWKGMQEYPVGGGMGMAAERLAEKYNLSREEQDALALSSHQRAVRAIKEGRFKKEIIPVEVPSGKGKKGEVTTDEHPREDTNVESLSRLKSAFKEGGSVTAGNSSGLNDGAAAIILMSEEKAKERGLKPLATIRSYWSVASDPYLVGLAPVPAIKKILEETHAVLLCERSVTESVVCAPEHHRISLSTRFLKVCGRTKWSLRPLGRFQQSGSLLNPKFLQNAVCAANLLRYPKHIPDIHRN